MTIISAFIFGMIGGIAASLASRALLALRRKLGPKSREDRNHENTTQSASHFHCKDCGYRGSLEYGNVLGGDIPYIIPLRPDGKIDESR